MVIRSGTTRERLIRLGIFCLMCAVASALFLRDAYDRYPRQNAEQARGEFPEIVTELPRIDRRVTKAHFQRIEEGRMSLEEAEQILGQPSYRNERMAFWVGPAGFVKADLGRGDMISRARWTEGRRTSRDLLVQKVLGALAAILVIPALVALVRAAGTRIVLDEKGLTINREEVIRWEQIRGLDASLYKRKGWITLEYDRDGARRQQRLDNYHIARFDEIVNMICQQKGIESPIQKKQPDEKAGAQPERPSA